MKKSLYSGAKVYEIFSQLQRRGLAMFLGVKNGQPMIWMTERTPLCYAPISIATAKVVLDEIMIREFEGIDGDVLIGEVIDSLHLCQRRQPRRRTIALITSAEVM